MVYFNKIALVTGSAKGLGKMTALSLAEMGFHIAINYLTSRKEANELVREIEQFGVRSIAVQADLTKRDDVKRLVADVTENLGPIDVVINNAGPFIRERRRFADYTEDEIEYLMRGNLLSVLELNRMVIPHMRAKGWGRIIHFGFGLASEARGWPHRAVYAAAKVGLVSFTKTLALEEAEFGITVNMICPGDIKGKYKEKKRLDVQNEIDFESPRGRPGTGEDVARMIQFLCAVESDFITGNIIDVSGGLDPIRSIIEAET